MADKKTLREYMQENEFYYVPEIFDCISTRAAAMTGFKMIMISSSDFSCSQGGNPDLNLMTAEDYARMTRAIKRMNRIHGMEMPLFIDADEGFGSPLQTYHGVSVMAEAGADCILITDGMELGRPGLASIEDACERLRAAKKGMEGTDCLLMASCKQNVNEQFDDFVVRCNAYIEAGADIICPLAIQRANDGKMQGGACAVLVSGSRSRRQGGGCGRAAEPGLPLHGHPHGLPRGDVRDARLQPPCVRAQEQRLRDGALRLHRLSLLLFTDDLLPQGWQVG